jgi:serine/threonine protein kinase/Tol biopolymer transport system component
MTAERWKRIEEVYHAALESDPAARGALIAEQCQGDEDLRKEVEELVRREESPGGDLLNRSPWQTRTEPGTRLGPYEIIEFIDAGGMGRVFRALDTRLGRRVAIKTSEGNFPERFAREARTIASLSHPNICTVHDVGPDYLVMELIEGPTLADRIRQGPLPLDQALDIARQIAAALKAAHDSGIVHRDLKPANIKIAPGGHVKVLDFGLARPLAQPSEPGDAAAMTASGMILGSPGYMSPEQACGQEVDQSTDIWAFGAIVYEMLTGERPFKGKTAQEALASILQQEPDLARVPRKVSGLLSRCLDKNPKTRLRDIGDWERLLNAEPPSPARVRLKNWRVVLAASVALFAAGAVAAWTFWSGHAVSGPVTRFQVQVPDNVQFDEYVALSPDGRKLVFNATGGQNGLWVHDLDTLAWRRLEGTEGARAPFWSPDSRFLGFAVNNQIKKIDVNAGRPVTLCTIPGPAGMGAWSKEGVIVFGGQGVGRMRKVPDTGGVPVDLTAPDPATRAFDSFPSFLPDGKHFLYLRAIDVRGNDSGGVFAGSVDAAPAEQSRERILATPFAAQYREGNLFFIRAGELMAQPFDLAKLVLHGDPVRIAEHAGVIRHYSVFSVSPTALVYRTSANTTPGDQLTWVDRQGNVLGHPWQPSVGIRLSPDGTRGAVRDAPRDAPGDLWILNFATGGRARFTFHQSWGSWGEWSPDGARVFYAAVSPPNTIFEKAADGTGAEKAWLTEPGRYHRLTGFTPDGRYLLYNADSTPPSTDMWLLRLDDSRQRFHLMGPEGQNGRISPDGRWMAYISSESGKPEIYVRPFLSSAAGHPSLGESKWQISRDGAQITTPRWRGDGKELYFMDAHDAIEAVDVDGSRAAFQAGDPKPLLTMPCNCGWDVTPDGQRFAVTSAAGAGGKAPITVVLNWQADLKKR